MMMTRFLETMITYKKKRAGKNNTICTKKMTITPVCLIIKNERKSLNDTKIALKSLISMPSIPKQISASTISNF